jgi:hypothetical protein
MLHQPLFEKGNATCQTDEKDGSVYETGSPPKEQSGMFVLLNEDLAIRIAAEVLTCFFLSN